MAEEVIDNRIDNNPCQTEIVDNSYPSDRDIKITKLRKGENTTMIDYNYYNISSIMSIDEIYGFVDFKFTDWISFKLDGSDKDVMKEKLDNLCLTIIKSVINYFKTNDNKIYEKIKFLE